MDYKRQISATEAYTVGVRLGLNWAQVDLEQFRHGLEVELDRSGRRRATPVTYASLVLMGKIAWTHLKETRDYYSQLGWFAARAES